MHFSVPEVLSTHQKNTGASLFLMEVELSCREEKVRQTPQPIWFCGCLVIYNSKLFWSFLVRSILPFWCHKPIGDQPVNGSPGSPEIWWSCRWIRELPTTVTFYSLTPCGSIVQWFTHFPNKKKYPRFVPGSYRCCGEPCDWGTESSFLSYQLLPCKSFDVLLIILL